MSLDKFVVRIPDQIPSLLQSFRKQAGLTQAELAERMGVTQQSFSALERNAGNMSAANLIKVLNILGIDLILQERTNIAQDTAGTYRKQEW
jgi:HTH-type transcriptional regulator / antitoxin HipB